MMSFTTGLSSVTASCTNPINLTSMANMANMANMPKLDMANIKTEADDINSHTAIKRHTIDAILGLPRLAGFHPDLGDLNNGINRSSLSESDAELVDKEKQSLDVDGRS